MPLFLQLFVLPVAAGTVLLILTNPMGFDWTQRIAALLAITFAAFFIAYTVDRRTAESASIPVQPEQSQVEPEKRVEQPAEFPQQSAPSIQQSTSGAGGVAIVGDGNVVETNVLQDSRRLEVRAGSMQIHVGQKADLFQAPSMKITNIGEVGVTIAGAGYLVGEERREIKGLKVNGKLNHSWPYYLKPAESVDAYLLPADLEGITGKRIIEVYVQTGDGKQYRVSDQSELAEFIRVVDEARR